MAPWLIFALGTNNWQAKNEAAPGSGILHSGQHAGLNALPRDRVAGCFGMWPSQMQKSDPARDDYRVFELSHPIPICESASPVSSYRWHSMSVDEINAYRERMVVEVMAFLSEIEERPQFKSVGATFNLFIAHHTFLNPVVMAEVNRRRVKDQGKPRAPLAAFAHGTALKMYQNEIKELPDFSPPRFLPLIRDELHLFEDTASIDLVFVVAQAQHDTFRTVFPNFPAERVIVCPCGYSPDVFAPAQGVTRTDVFAAIAPRVSDMVTEPCDAAAIERLRGLTGIPVENYDRILLFSGKFADWKRMDVFLKAVKAVRSAVSSDSKDTDPHATALRGQRIAAVLCGGGMPKDEGATHKWCYEQLCDEASGLANHVYFLGPQMQNVLAKINTVVDVGVFPSKDEPFGLVFIETMACGTPVIGARSGGPAQFVLDSVGALIDESDDKEVLTARLTAVILKALAEDWKKTKGPEAAAYAIRTFTLKVQCDNMLGIVDHIVTPAAAAANSSM